MGTYLHPDAPPALDGVVALYSGGVDSYCMSYLCDPDVLLYVNMGGRYGDAEASRLTTPPGMQDRLVRLACPVIGEREDEVTSIVPGRNAFLALMGSWYGSTLLLASIYEEAHVGGADKDDGFCRAIEQLCNHMYQPQRWIPAGRTITMRTPVHELTKAQLVGRALLAGHNPTLLAANTFSCYSPVRYALGDSDGNVSYGTWRACGKCGACARKWAAFAVWGVDVGFSKPREALLAYVKEADRLVGTPAAGADNTHQWIIDQHDAWHGIVRDLSQAAAYPMWERVCPLPQPGWITARQEAGRDLL